MTETEQVRFERSPTRCPYCKDDIEAVGSVACVHCLARHHPDCWDEVAACSVCGSKERLEPADLPAGAPVAQVAQAPDRTSSPKLAPEKLPAKFAWLESGRSLGGNLLIAAIPCGVGLLATQTTVDAVWFAAMIVAFFATCANTLKARNPVSVMLIAGLTALPAAMVLGVSLLVLEGDLTKLFIQLGIGVSIAVVASILGWVTL